MRTLFTSKAAPAAPPIQKPLWSALLKGMATALIATTIFTIQPTTQAQASWWCWSWWGCEAPALPSAQSLINERPYLKGLPASDKSELIWLIETYRNSDAPEKDIKLFLDELNLQYHSSNQSRIPFSGIIIANAYAGNPFKPISDFFSAVFGKTKGRVTNPLAHKNTSIAARQRILSRLSNRDKDGNYSNIRPQDTQHALRHGDRVRTLVRDKNGRYWLREFSGKRITPSGKYVYATMTNGEIRITRNNNRFSPHLQLSEGAKVRYAGEIRFENKGSPSRGFIKGWNNGSGHYKPHRFDKARAGLPLELFKLWNLPL